MKRNVRAIAKNDVKVFLCKKANGVSYASRNLLKGAEINLPVVSDQKLVSETLIAILGERNIVFAEDDHFISVYSKDFEFQKL
jgi:hypothetical protein